MIQERTLQGGPASRFAAAAAFCVLALNAAAEGPRFSGFLGEYSQLERRSDPDLVYNYRYVRPDIDWKAYSGILVETVKVYLKPGAQSPGFDPHDLEALSDHFEHSFLRELGSDYGVVQEAQPGVLRLRIAITEVVPVQARQSKGVDFLPILLIGRALKGRSISVNVGSVAIEAELIDEASGQRLAAVVSSKTAAGTDADGKRPSTWQEAQEAMDFWAHRLRLFLDETRTPPGGR